MMSRKPKSDDSSMSPTLDPPEAKPRTQPIHIIFSSMIITQVYAAALRPILEKGVSSYGEAANKFNREWDTAITGAVVKQWCLDMGWTIQTAVTVDFNDGMPVQAPDEAGSVAAIA